MNRALRKRFLPLYIAAFFHGLIFWYAIEKVFETSELGLTPQKIAAVTMAVVVGVLLTELPSGIMADRWSRKGMLMVSTSMLFLSTVVGGLSHSQISYMFAGFLWGVFYGTFSGIYETLVYDTLLDEGSSGKLYERYLGRMLFINSAGLVISSLASGLIASKFGIRSPYFISIPSTLLCFVALICFKEPKLHRKSAAATLVGHLGEMVTNIVKDHTIVALLLPIAGAAILFRIILEFNQLYYIALLVPLVLYGPFTALIQSSIGAGGFIAGRVKGKQVFYGLLVAMVMSSVLLTFKLSIASSVIGQTVLITSAFAISVVLEGKLHSKLSSTLRAGATSTANTIAQIVFLPIAYFFGFVTQHFSVFQASWLIVAIALLVAIGSLQHTDRAETKV